MNKKKATTTLNVLIALLMLILLVAGIFGVRTTKRVSIEGSPELEHKLAAVVGSIYTNEKHSEVLRILELNEQVGPPLNESLLGLSQLARNIGVAVILLVTANLVLEFRSKQQPQEAGKDAPSNGG